jgi:LysM domain
MPSLNSHLTKPDLHAQLPFHPCCPICQQERLGGALRNDPTVPRRVQACLAAGVLALSTVAPGVSIAQAPSSEGTAPPQTQPGLGDPQQFDPGGEVGLPNEVAHPTAPIPGGGAAGGGGGPLEREPDESLTAPASPPITRGDGATPALPPAVTGAPTQHTPPTAEGAPPAADQRTATDPPHGERRERAAQREEKRGDAGTDRRRERSPVGPAAAVPAAEPALTGTPPTAAGRSSDQRDDVGGSSGRVHVVRAGESLWAIAVQQLGADATPAEIARYVNRLWQLNHGRIGTGHPDLIMVGTRLRLPA